MSGADVSRRGVLATALAAASSAPALAQAETPPKPVRNERRRGPAGKEPWLGLPALAPLPAARWSEIRTADGATLAYAEFGSGSRPVLFLHGGYGSSTCWSQQIASLSGPYRVIALDTRGHGRSALTSKTFGYPAFAKDVDTLLARLGIASTAVVGWSDGAITGLQLAMTYPERVDRLFAFAANVTPDGTLAGASRTPTFASYVARCKAEYGTLSKHPERWPDLIAGCGVMWKREPNFAWPSLGKIRARVAVAVAAHDELIRPDHAARIAGTIQGAKLVTLPDVSHFAMYQDPAGFTSALATFLA